MYDFYIFLNTPSAPDLALLPNFRTNCGLWVHAWSKLMAHSGSSLFALNAWTEMACSYMLSWRIEYIWRMRNKAASAPQGWAFHHLSKLASRAAITNTALTLPTTMRHWGLLHKKKHFCVIVFWGVNPQGCIHITKLIQSVEDLSLLLQSLIVPSIMDQWIFSSCFSYLLKTIP